MEKNRGQFPSDIREVRQRDAGVLKRIDIDLSIALIDQAYHISGNYFYLYDMPSGTYIDIKVNETRESPVSYVEQVGQITPFDTLYITTPAGQTGTAVLLYGTEAPDLVSMIDNRAAVSGDIEAVRDELRGDTTPENWGEVTVGVAQVELLAASANRKACWIHSDIENTGNIYLGFDNTVTTAVGGNNWFACLTPGQGWGVDDYRGAIHAIATVAAQAVGVGEW